MAKPQKQTIEIPFAQGLGQKVDPWRLPAGNFIRLVNSVFEKEGRLQKRNGYGKLATLTSAGYTFLTTLSDNLIAIGSKLAAYSSGTNQWLEQGPTAPLTMSTLPLVRNSLNQIQADSATSSNGLTCTAYTETGDNGTDYKFAVFDSTTGQNIYPPSLIPGGLGAITGTPRVFLVAQYFVVMYTCTISGTAHLQYIVIPTSTPTSVSGTFDVASAYDPASTVSWDGVTANDTLYVAYNTSAGGQSVKITYLTPQILASAFGSPISPPTPHTFAGAEASMMSLSADTTISNPVVYLAYWASGDPLSVAAVFLDLSVALAPHTSSVGGATLLNITSAAQNGGVAAYYEVENAYGYDAAIPTNYIKRVAVTQAGSVGSPRTSVRGVGLASKAFIVDSTEYILTAYQSPYQPTYFLVNGTLSTHTNPVVVAKLAYENGGGYLTTGLPLVTVDGDAASVPYLFKDLVQASSRASQNNSKQLASSPVYTQTGINTATFDFSEPGLGSVETAQSLQFTGGFMWQYDGITPVEENFFLWPDSVEVTTATSTLTPTADLTSGSFVLTAVSAMTGVGIGMSITGTDIPANTTVVSFTDTTITMSHAAAGTHVGETVTLAGRIAAKPDGATNTNAYYAQIVYEWTDNRGLIHRSTPSIPVGITTAGAGSAYRFTYHVPMLRLTYKIDSPVKITAYRWSAGQQNYYQITSIQQPYLNDTQSDYIDIVDALPDADILGNTLLYTTGGVVENTNAPASNVITMFDDRVWSLSAEDPNTWWFSKTVVQGTPVEMSDLFTYYVAPATAAQGPTGPITSGAPMDDKLISFKKNAIYYTNGTGPDSTGANSQYSQPIFVTSTVGCDNQQSIVFTDVGLMFQSDKGIWLLRRDLVTVYIGADVEDFNDQRVLSAVCVPGTNQVRFTLDNGVTLMYDYFFKQWGTFEGVPSVSSCVYQDLHAYLDSAGSAFQETPGEYLDNGNPVLMSFTTAWLKLGGIQGYQRAFFFYLLGEYLSPHVLQLGIAYDYNEAIVQAPLIRPTNYSTPAGTGVSQSPAGQQSTAGGPASLERWRVFFSRQRCQAVQVSLQEFYDPTIGGSPGAGFTMSGFQLVAGVKGSFRPTSAQHSVGGG